MRDLTETPKNVETADLSNFVMCDLPAPIVQIKGKLKRKMMNIQ